MGLMMKKSKMHPYISKQKFDKVILSLFKWRNLYIKIILIPISSPFEGGDFVVSSVER